MIYYETCSHQAVQCANVKTCFDHDSPTAAPDVNTFHSETRFIRDQTKHVSF